MPTAILHSRATYGVGLKIVTFIKRRLLKFCLIELAGLGKIALHATRILGAVDLVAAESLIYKKNISFRLNFWNFNFRYLFFLKNSLNTGHPPGLRSIVVLPLRIYRYRQECVQNLVDHLKNFQR